MKISPIIMSRWDLPKTFVFWDLLDEISSSIGELSWRRNSQVVTPQEGYINQVTLVENPVHAPAITYQVRVSMAFHRQAEMANLGGWSTSLTYKRNQSRHLDFNIKMVPHPSILSRECLTQRSNTSIYNWTREIL